MLTATALKIRNSLFIAGIACVFGVTLPACDEEGGVQVPPPPSCGPTNNIISNRLAENDLGSTETGYCFYNGEQAPMLLESNAAFPMGNNMVLFYAAYALQRMEELGMRLDDAEVIMYENPLEACALDHSEHEANGQQVPFSRALGMAMQENDTAAIHAIIDFVGTIAGGELAEGVEPPAQAAQIALNEHFREVEVRSEQAYPSVTARISCPQPESGRMGLSEVTRFLHLLRNGYFVDEYRITQLTSNMRSSRDELEAVIREEAAKFNIPEEQLLNYIDRTQDKFLLSVSNGIPIAGGTGPIDANVMGWLWLPEGRQSSTLYSYACAIHDNSDDRDLHQGLVDARARAARGIICESLRRYAEALRADGLEF